MRINSLHDALAYFPDIDGIWQADNLPETESRIQSRLPAEAGPERAALLTQLARVHALQGKFPEARAALDEAQQMIPAPDSPAAARAQVRILLEQGRVTCLSMSPTKAHDIFARAWTLATDSNLPFFAIDAALMLSSIRPPKFQNEWLKKALDIVESSGDTNVRLWLAQLLFLQGWHEYDFRQFEGALESFTRALEQPLIIADETKGFALQWSRARTLRALGRTQDALVIQEGLLDKMRAKGKVNGHVYLEVAECKQLLNAKEEAKSYFESAYAELSANSWYSDNRIDELERMKYLYKKR